MKNKIKKFVPNIKTTYKEKDIKKPLKYYDGSLGIKLTKHKSNSKKDSKRRKTLETGIHNSIVGVNCIVNEVSIKDSKINPDTKIKKVKDFSYKSHTSMSIKRYSTDTLMFRRRFITLVSSYILLNEKRIYAKLSKPYRGLKLYEKFRMIKDHEFYELYINFVLNILGQKKKYLSPSLFDMYFILNDSKSLKTLDRHYRKVSKDLDKSYAKIFGEKSGKTLMDIFNFSAILATGNGDINLFTNKQFKGLSSEDDLEKLISKLGRKVIKNGSSPLFRIYLQCNPKIRTMYVKEVMDDNVAVGLLALSFIDFMFNDKTLKAVVQNLLRRPWVNEKKAK